MLVDYIKDLIAEIMRLDAEHLDSSMSFDEINMSDDNLYDLYDALSQEYQIPMGEQAFDTIGDLVDYIENNI